MKEIRHIALNGGRQEIKVEDVPSMIDASSVGVKSLSGPAFQVLEQNYQFDLISPAAILNKSVGKRVRLVRTIGITRDVLEGTLISAPTAVVSTGEGPASTYNGLVIKTDDGRIVLDPTGEIEVTEVPEGLISVPTLLWNLDSQKSGDSTVEMSYITQGMKWNADYVLTLDPTYKNSSLKGWVTMTNSSGTAYNNAKLKLLAGDINVVSEPETRLNQEIAKGGVSGFNNAGAFGEERLFEYHLYTLQRPATLRNNETKQLSLLESNRVQVKKLLIVDSTADDGTYYPSENQVGTGPIKPVIKITFTNDEASGLNMPLPMGRIRIYQRDKSGSVQMLGEDNIQHTPRKEKLSLTVGKAFDLVAERHRLTYHKLGKNSASEKFVIKLRNRKDSAETVTVLERHWGDWKVSESNLPFNKEDANTQMYSVTLAPNQTRKVTYTVTTKW